MTDTEDKTTHVALMPLNRIEDIAMVGASMVVLGTLLPAFNRAFARFEV